MKKYLYIAAAAIAVLSACNKEIVDTPINDTKAPVFTATIEPETKTTLANGTKVNWEGGDEVYLSFYNEKALNHGGYTQFSGEGTIAYSLNVFTATPSASEAGKGTLKIKDGETYNANANLLAQAVYPASIFESTFGNTVLIGTQTYKGDDKIGFAPMYYVNEDLFYNQNKSMPATLQFKNVCALLKITVPYSQITSVRTITVSSNKQMNGGAKYHPTESKLYFEDPDTYESGQNQIQLDCYSLNNSNVVIPADGSRTFYLSVPAQDYGFLQIEVTDGTLVKTMKTKAASITIARNKIYPITFADNNPDSNLLPGRFTVSGSKSVQFTKGNLWCNTTTSPVTYAFEAKQYDYPANGENAYNTSHVGHFYWSKTASVSFAASYNDSTNENDEFWCNENNKLTVSGTSNLYALSSSEWYGLVFWRYNAANLRKFGVTVAGKTNCLVLAPDGYTGTIATEYTADEWETAEETGLVCLPAPGGRSGSGIWWAASYGDYWSSTPHNDNVNNACYLSIGPDAVNTTNGSRDYGRCIRLVKTAK